MIDQNDGKQKNNIVHRFIFINLMIKNVIQNEQILLIIMISRMRSLRDQTMTTH